MTRWAASPRLIAQKLTWTGTFHSLGNRLLRHYAPQLGLDPNFSVIDRSDSADLMDQLRTELGFAAKQQRFPRKDTCLAIYSHRVNTQKSLKETLEQQFPWCVQWEQDLTQLYRGYVERKQKFSLLDYDDLLLYWHLLMSEPALAKLVGTHFDHVLVDEYQDTNNLQAQHPRGAQARRAGAHRGRRRRAVHLLVPRRGGGEHPQLSAALHAQCGSDSAGAELSLDAAGARRVQRIDGRGAAPVPQAPAGDARRRYPCRAT